MTYYGMTWRTLTCYDSRAVTVQPFPSAVGLLLHGLAGPFATGARGRKAGGGGGGGGGERGVWVRRKALVQANASLLAWPLFGCCTFANNS